MKQVWQIDPEFKRLSVPLSPEEERKLENSLVREGSKNPLRCGTAAFWMDTSVMKFAATRKWNMKRWRWTLPPRMKHCFGLAKSALQRQSTIPLRFDIFLERDTFLNG